MSGLIFVSRDVFKHQLFDGDKLSRREAWLWLLSEAAWRPCQKNIGGAMLKLDRGQLSHSLRFMARKWGWSKDSVRRFLSRLETETMLTQKVRQGQMVISICNYNTYQDVKNYRETVGATNAATRPRQQRDKEENLNNNYPKGGATAPSVSQFIFAKGKELLSQAEKPVAPSSAGGVINKWLRDHGDQKVIAAMAACEAKKTPQPLEYITGYLRDKKPGASERVPCDSAGVPLRVVN